VVEGGGLMHAEAHAFVRQALAELPVPRTVVELGGLDFNGSIRDLFSATAYCSVDLVAGKSVDVVADAAEFTPPESPDMVVCCEVLEHSPRADQIVRNAIRMLAPGGALLVTCATEPRAAHSAVDGNALRSGEWYQNVAVDAFRGWLDGVQVRQLEVLPRGDLHCLAVKPGLEARKP
jgi:SAM-dependent methyltransferase